jgi:hypothetical protein
MKRKKGKIPFAALPVAFVITVCLQGVFGITALASLISTPTPLPPRSNPLAETAAAIGLTQTAVSLPTFTLTSSLTASASPTLASTATFAPTKTDTPMPTATLILFTAPPAGGSVGGPCSCNGDTMNCSDFRNQKAAQACYDHCKSQGFGDVHRLDRDKDGIACEG